MKRKFTILLAALLLMSGLTWAQTTINWSASDQGYENQQVIESVEFDANVTGSFDKGTNSNAPKYYNTGTAIRCYGGNHFTVTSTGGNLQAITLSFGSSDGTNAITTDCGSYSNGSWVGDAESVTFTIGGTSGHRRIAGFEITYGGEAPSVAMPTFSPAGGTYTEAQTVTISCETEGATIYYTTDGTEPTNESTQYSEAITVSESTTVKAIAYVGTEASNVASATYTIVLPVTIAEARAQGTGTVCTTGIVTSCVSTTGYIQDATAAICVYGTSLTVGDEITVSGTLSTYNGLLEITNPTFTVLSSGNTVTPTVKTIAEINADDYTSSSSIQGLYVTIEAATVTAISGQNTTIEQDGNSIVVRGISGVEYTVNDVISLDGNIGCFNGAQIANPQNVVVQANENPVINASDVTLAYDATSGEIAYTIDNPVTGATVAANTTAEWLTIGTVGETVPFTCTVNEGTERAATVTLTYTYGDDETVTKNVTVTQEAYVAPALDYATLPFEFDGNQADIEGTDGLTENGLGSYGSSPKLKFDNTGDWLLLHFNEVPGTLTFDIKGNSFSGGTFTVQTSEDGETYTDLATYTTLGATQSESFNTLGENVRYIKWIYTEKSSGNVALGNIALAQPSTEPTITLSAYAIDATAAETEGTLEVTYANITEIVAEVQFCDAEGEAATYDWITADINDSNNVDYLIGANDGEARTAYFKVYALDDEANDVYSDLVTVTQEAYVAPVPTEDYALFTGDLIEGDYIIYYDGKAMNTTVSSDRLQYAEVTPANDVIATNDAAIVWHIAKSGEYWTIYNAAANAYAAGTGTKNKAQMLEDGTDDKAKWTVSSGEDFEFVNKKNAESNVNANLRNNGTYGFACYSTSTGGALTLYKKVTSTVSYNKTIAGYGDSDGGYYLIASPIYGLNPANIAGMTTGDYDLYAFDQSETDAWRNYKANAFQYLVPGKGYLYASQGGVASLTFEGMPYEGNGVVALSYDADASLAGWNLIGNPLGSNATLSQAYYRLNADGSALNATTENIAVGVMEGVFVQATETGQTATFTAQTRGTAAHIAQANIVVKQNGTTIDNAIVRFDGGSTLGKLQLFEGNAKVYFTDNGHDYAVIRSEARGEMPVNFKAAQKGTYTLSVEAENLDMTYLHLIDNLTGMDVDLLQTPSYTFEGNTSDYASRFRMLFRTNNIDDNSLDMASDFAFLSDGQLILTGDIQNAKLQIIDMMGRVLLNSEATPCVSTDGMAPGVYMLQLVNGTNVKTQKIVVK